MQSRRDLASRCVISTRLGREREILSPSFPFLRVKNERRVPYTFERRFVVGVEDGTSWVGGEERLDVRNVKCQVFEYFEWERIIFSPRSIIGDVLFRNF